MLNLIERGLVNGFIRESLAKYDSALPTIRNNIKQNIEQVYNNDKFTYRITDSSITLINSKFEDLSLLCKYKPYELQRGMTYLLVTDSEKGEAHFILVVKGNDGVRIPDDVCNEVERLIVKYKRNGVVFNRNIFDELSYKFVTYNIEDITHFVSGNSYKLGLTMALFSYVSHLVLPGNVAFSGDLSGNNGIISLVNGLNAKTGALLREFPDVDTLFLPTGLSVNEEYGIKVANVDRADQVVENVFSDLVTSKLDVFEGELVLETTTVEIDGQIFLELKLEPYSKLESDRKNYSCAILRQLTNELKSLEGFGVIISFGGPIFVHSMIALEVKNRFRVVSHYDPKLKSAVVVFSMVGRYKVGDLIRMGSLK